MTEPFALRRGALTADVGDASNFALAAFRSALDAQSDEQVVRGLAEGLAGVVRGHSRSQISGAARQRLVEALFRAEDAARAILPVWFFEERVRHGCISVFGLLNAWAEPLGSQARLDALPVGTELVARIVANDLDSLCAGLELQRLGAPPPVTSPVLAGPITKH